MLLETVFSHLAAYPTHIIMLPSKKILLLPKQKIMVNTQMVSLNILRTGAIKNPTLDKNTVFYVKKWVIPFNFYQKKLSKQSFFPQ